MCAYLRNPYETMEKMAAATLSIIHEIRIRDKYDFALQTTNFSLPGNLIREHPVDDYINDKETLRRTFLLALSTNDKKKKNKLQISNYLFLLLLFHETTFLTIIRQKNINGSSFFSLSLYLLNQHNHK